MFAPCPRGLEQLLADELGALGADDCRTVASGVAFSGDRRLAYAANLHSRLASRVLVEVARRRYRNDDDLYRLAAGVDWETRFDPDLTLRVDTSAIRSPVRSLNFATLRVKDAIVDRLRDRTGRRPSIDTRQPDVRVWLFLEARDATLYLDLSGEPLFKRGWRSEREDRGDAPLKENLAAGLLALAGWTPATPLVDPFCGSGTIAIEAASIAHDLAPGLSRSFGFERLLDHDPALWSSLRAAAIRRAQAGAATPARIAGSDVDAAAVARARRNLARAGLPESAVRWAVGDLARIGPPFETPGFVVTNPPYGERIAARHEQAGDRDDALPSQRRRHGDATPARRPDRPSHRADRHEATMQAIGEAFRRDWPGWQVWMLSSDPALPAQLGMKARRRTPLYNGAIECRLFGFEVFSREP
ncbi:MAG: class I SAM-dependent RNA methyltransferase [Limnobacter sp.]|nr:class I SAM-dependent RNA methyltransferase [Limnobacter sp.]